MDSSNLLAAIAQEVNMPYEISWHEAPPTFRIRVTGACTIPLVMAAYQEVINHPKWTPGTSMLWDSTGVTSLVATPEDMNALDAFLAEHIERIGAGRSAVVVRADVHEELGKLAGARARRQFGRDVRMFRSVEEAEAWLNSAE